MSYSTLILEVPDRSIATLRSALDRTSKAESMRLQLNELQAVMLGVRRGHVHCNLANVRASQTVTCDVSAAVDATDDITIGGSAGGTLSVEAAPSGEDEFDGGATDTEFADNLVAAVNAHSAISKLVFAVRTDTDVVTLYSIFPGPIGNLITLSETGNGMTLGAAALAGGAADEVDSYQFGYDPLLA